MTSKISAFSIVWIGDLRKTRVRVWKVEKRPVLARRSRRSLTDNDKVLGSHRAMPAQSAGGCTGRKGSGHGVKVQRIVSRA